MKTHDIMDWYSADELHKTSQDWLVELEFIKDEHLFFEDIVTSFTLQLIDELGFEKDVEIIDALNMSQKQNNSLIKEIKKHDKNLIIMVDSIDQPKEEREYKKEHRKLMTKVSEYLKEYKSLKTQLFAILTDIFKKEKQKRLMA
jgi:hypothetical protein